MFRKLYTSSFKLTISTLLPKTRQLTRTCQRAFSREQLEIANDKRIKLVKALHQTTQIFKEDYEPKESMAKFFKERGYEIIESSNKDFVELRRYVGKMIVQICFHAKPPRVHEGEMTNFNKAYSPFEYDESERSDEEEEDSEDEDSETSQKLNKEDHYKFSVFVTQPNGKSLVFECFSYNLLAHIENISVIENIEEYKHRLQEEKFNTYLADFHLLDEIFQSSMRDYLDRFGVDTHLMYWIANFSIDKEQRLWMDFLDETQKFIENPVKKY